jgi:hypothetical protein
VIVETVDAYTRLAPPLLNRFEKQVFERKNPIESSQQTLLDKLQQFIHYFVDFNSEIVDKIPIIPVGIAKKSICGYHSDILSSLVLAVTCSTENIHQSVSSTEVTDVNLVMENEYTLFAQCIDRLLWITTPEHLCCFITENSGKRNKYLIDKFGIDCADIYIKKQTHSSLSAYVEQFFIRNSVHNSSNNNTNIPFNGPLDASLDAPLSTPIIVDNDTVSQTVIMTYSAMNKEACDIVNSCVTKHLEIEIKTNSLVKHLVLHEFDQELSLQKSVAEFFKTATPSSILLIQCDPMATSKRRIEHTKFIVEAARTKYLKTCLEKRNKLESIKMSGKIVIGKCVDEQSIVDSLEVNTHQPLSNQKGNETDMLNYIPVRLHVLLLVHLPRGDVESVHQHSVDFDSRWQYAFVDLVASAKSTGLPDIEVRLVKYHPFTLIIIITCTFLFYY